MLVLVLSPSKHIIGRIEGLCYDVQLSDLMTLNPPVWKPEVFSSSYSDTPVN